MHIEGAANRVAPEQEALWPAQDFRTLEVVEARDNCTVATFVEIVLEERRGRVAANAEILGAYAANGYAIDEGVGAVTRYAGRERDEILDVIEIGVPDEIEGQGGDGEWYVLNTLFAIGCRNGDIFDLLGHAGT